MVVSVEMDKNKGNIMIHKLIMVGLCSVLNNESELVHYTPGASFMISTLLSWVTLYREPAQ